MSVRIRSLKGTIYFGTRKTDRVISIEWENQAGGDWNAVELDLDWKTIGIGRENKP